MTRPTDDASDPVQPRPDPLASSEPFPAPVPLTGPRPWDEVRAPGHLFGRGAPRVDAQRDVSAASPPETDGGFGANDRVNHDGHHGVDDEPLDHDEHGVGRRGPDHTPSDVDRTPSAGRSWDPPPLPERLRARSVNPGLWSADGPDRGPGDRPERDAAADDGGDNPWIDPVRPSHDDEIVEAEIVGEAPQPGGGTAERTPGPTPSRSPLPRTTGQATPPAPSTTTGADPNRAGCLATSAVLVLVVAAVGIAAVVLTPLLRGPDLDTLKLSTDIEDLGSTGNRTDHGGSPLAAEAATDQASAGGASAPTATTTPPTTGPGSTAPERSLPGLPTGQIPRVGSDPTSPPSVAREQLAAALDLLYNPDVVRCVVESAYRTFDQPAIDRYAYAAGE